jgi:hypothetical protein
MILPDVYSYKNTPHEKDTVGIERRSSRQGHFSPSLSQNRA